jgi:CHASE3 domain sensor protein
MKNTSRKVLFAFVLGMVLMFVLDLFFHFNNSVKIQMDREANKAQKKIENIFK